jgi:integrase
MIRTPVAPQAQLLIPLTVCREPSASATAPRGITQFRPSSSTFLRFPLGLLGLFLAASQIRRARRSGEFLKSFKTAWESLLLLANGHDTKRAKPGARVDRDKLRQIDLHWHDMRHEGACRLLADGVDIRTIQLMLGHADIKQTQRYLNITDEELRKAMTGVWERRRQLHAVGN